MFRVLFLCMAWAICTLEGHAQDPMVQEKHLLVALGAGTGLASYSGGLDSIDAQHVTFGHVHFSFGFALSRRFSLGVRYGRTGTDRLPEIYRLARTTSYQLLMCYRPLLGARGSLEFDLGLGTGIAALRRNGSRIPERATGGEATLGVRFMRMLSNTVGVFARAEATGSDGGPLTLDNEPIRDTEGRGVDVAWSSGTVSTGILVRF